MRSIGLFGAAIICITAATSSTAHAQGRSGKSQQGKTLPAPAAAAHQRVAAKQEQQRAAQYGKTLPRQVQTVQQQSVQLQQQRRSAQYRVQQQYAKQLQKQQKQLPRTRNYASDPYVTAPLNYRYTVQGATRETNQYGANVLRQAVDYGYQQGYAAGQADRQDHWASNYKNSAAYRDANYGYRGNYVDQSDYNYYFRQGVQRGYADGYNSQLQYGTASNGTYSILSSVLSSILGLQPIQ
jgi:hypothetical protein